MEIWYKFVFKSSKIMYSKYVLCIYNVSRRFGILHVMTFQYIVIYLLVGRKMLIFICAVVWLNVSLLVPKFHLHLPQEKSQQTWSFNILIFCQYVIALLYITLHLQWPFYMMQYRSCSLEKGVKKFKRLNSSSIKYPIHLLQSFFCPRIL